MITSTSDFKLLDWRHSGFSVHNEARIAQDDAAGRMKLTGYMLRAPIALEKMRYDRGYHTWAVSAAQSAGRTAAYGRTAKSDERPLY
jgi:hypothetical protein